ncbi:MAG: hypothetical protein AB1635_10925 [Acidobacteriota bacterium]
MSGAATGRGRRVVGLVLVPGGIAMVMAAVAIAAGAFQMDDVVRTVAAAAIGAAGLADIAIGFWFLSTSKT